MTSAIKRQGKGNGVEGSGIPRMDLTKGLKAPRAANTKTTRKRESSVAVADAPPLLPVPPAPADKQFGGDVRRLEELIDGVLDKSKELKLAGMINRNGADWIQHNLIKCLAIIEGMK